MKKRTYFFALLAFASLLLAGTGCSDSPESDPPPRLPKGEFSITLSNITYSSVDISIVAQDKTQTYYSHVVAKEAFARNWKSNVTTFMTEYMAYLGEEYGMSKAEVAANLIDTGDSQWDYDRLEPDTEYVVFAVGLDEQGVLTTTAVLKEFTAAALPAVVPVTCTFEIQVSDISPTRALINVAPSSNQVAYYFDVVPVASYPSGDATAFLTQFVRQAAYDVMDQTGTSFEEAVAMLVTKGADGMDLFPGTLKPTTQYYVVAFGIDVYGRPTTAPATKKFSTQAIVPSSNTFTIVMEEVTAVNALAIITPANNDPYFAQFFTKAELAGLTDEQILEAILSQGVINATNTGEYWLDSGGRLFSGVEYEVLVFGYDEGVTTGITRQSFTTLAGGNPAQCSFDFSFTSGRGSVRIEVSPSDESVFYYIDLISKAAYPGDAVLIAAIETDLKNLAQDVGMPIPNVVLDFCRRGVAEVSGSVESLQEYVAIAFAIDLNGKAVGSVHKADYTAQEVILSNAKAAVRVLKYFSGQELFNYDPIVYEGGQGNSAYVLTEVTHNEDAANWYASIFSEDLTATSDENLIKNLVEWGGGEKNVDRLENWPSAYFFDVSYWGRDGIPNTLCAVAVDAEGNYGPIFKEVFKPMTAGASPISELIGAKVAAPKSQAPHKFRKEQSSVLENRLTPRSDVAKLPHLVFAAPAAKPTVSPIVGRQKSEGLPHMGNASRKFGSGNSSLTK